MLNIVEVKSRTLHIDENYKYKTRTLRHCYLTINAIDGSIIDRSLGY